MTGGGWGGYPLMPDVPLNPIADGTTSAADSAKSNFRRLQAVVDRAEPTTVRGMNVRVAIVCCLSLSGQNAGQIVRTRPPTGLAVARTRFVRLKPRIYACHSATEQ